VTEGQRPVIVNNVDFQKAFDCVYRPALWKILEQYGILKKVITNRGGFKGGRPPPPLPPSPSKREEKEKREKEGKEGKREKREREGRDVKGKVREG